MTFDLYIIFFPLLYGVFLLYIKRNMQATVSGKRVSKKKDVEQNTGLKDNFQYFCQRVLYRILETVVADSTRFHPQWRHGPCIVPQAVASFFGVVSDNSCGRGPVERAAVADLGRGTMGLYVAKWRLGTWAMIREACDDGIGSDGINQAVMGIVN
ncbi:hypothetical protein P152DRAFT_449845 [Eremomyces bilateralis CBS 781.70]|uniref:Uncharacterized protein n=1 Tax=Eremomyces bilateralis CBS 781.70 TaxID=1392243 RepID=A0A6G1G1Z3_9PEZI|nr:uncharacterized protein P152DRAFT_449845 [Eremomyces bilateralis CBS 781.70]KAF1812063.1 hypothetical protein P152DRAFT_449845 [Eremomyces bilateralis CBS 781.70]